MKDIVITADGIKIPAVLNETKAAHDFERRFPFKAICRSSEHSYSGNTAIGNYSPLETQNGWKNGDISVSGGWFEIFFDGEEHSKDYRDLMIVAHIRQKDLSKIRSLPETIHVTVDYATNI